MHSTLSVCVCVQCARLLFSLPLLLRACVVLFPFAFFFP